MSQFKVTLADIKQAREKIRGVIHPTETDLSRSLSREVNREVYLKFENLQRTGSFKVRGAYNKIMSLSEDEKKRGVVASSAGNHAQGVALSAHLAKVKAVVVMPEMASINKVSATRDYGAEVILHGDSYDEAYAHALHLQKTTGAVFVHPFQDEKIIAGQGTVGLEILEAVNDLDCVVVPVGGGGLISGIASAVKAIRPQCKVIGVQSVAAPGLTQLFNQLPYTPPVGRISTIADGISVKTPSPEMLKDFIKPLVDEMVLVTEDELAAAIVFLLERTKNLVEGSGAAAVAAVMSGKIPPGKKVCAVISGGNIDLNVIAKVIDRGLISQGRLLEISVIVDDSPGSLARLTQFFSDQKANVMDVRHDRHERGLSLKEAKVDFLLETMGREHGEEIRRLLSAAGTRLWHST